MEPDQTTEGSPQPQERSWAQRVLAPATRRPPKHPKADLPFLQRTLRAHKVEISVPSTFRRMDPHYIIFAAHYSDRSYESLCRVHKAYLPFLLTLGIPLDEIKMISFTSSGGVKAVFKSNAPLSKLDKPEYDIDGHLGVKLIKPFDPTWAITGLAASSATPEDITQVVSQFGTPAHPPEWEKTTSNIPTGRLIVTFATITPALALHHILDPAQMPHNVRASLLRFNPEHPPRCGKCGISFHVANLCPLERPTPNDATQAPHSNAPSGPPRKDPLSLVRPIIRQRLSRTGTLRDVANPHASRRHIPRTLPSSPPSPAPIEPANDSPPEHNDVSIDNLLREIRQNPAREEETQQILATPPQTPTPSPSTDPNHPAPPADSSATSSAPSEEPRQTTNDPTPTPTPSQEQLPQPSPAPQNPLTPDQPLKPHTLPEAPARPPTKTSSGPPKITRKGLVPTPPPPSSITTNGKRQSKPPDRLGRSN